MKKQLDLFFLLTQWCHIGKFTTPHDNYYGIKIYLQGNNQEWLNLIFYEFKQYLTMQMFKYRLKKDSERWIEEKTPQLPFPENQGVVIWN